MRARRLTSLIAPPVPPELMAFMLFRIELPRDDPIRDARGLPAPGVLFWRLSRAASEPLYSSHSAVSCFEARVTSLHAFRILALSCRWALVELPPSLVSAPEVSRAMAARSVLACDMTDSTPSAPSTDFLQPPTRPLMAS